MGRKDLPLPPPPARLARWLPSVPWPLVALWLLLVAVFGLAWLVFRDGAPEGAAADPRFATLLAWLPLVFVVLFAGFYLLARRAARRNQVGIDRLAAGDLDGAAALFRELARGRAFAVAGHFNLGLTLLRMADARGALAAFAAVERGRRRRGKGPLAAATAGNLALCNALLGQLDAADAWAREARARLARPGHASRLHLVAESIALVRRGQDEAAARRLAESWGEIELTTSGDLTRGLRLVRAYVVERAGGTAGEVEALLAGARPFRSGEYGWLYGAWKELEVWAAVKGFAAA